MRAGDTVKHRPTGEIWTLAYADERSGFLSWCGWPEGEAKIADCDLVASCSDEDHRKALETWASMKGDDRRIRVCQRQLWDLRIKLGELAPPAEYRVRYLQRAREALRSDFTPSEAEFATGWNEQEQRVADAIQEAAESNSNG